jgi:hypothetical protein
VLPQYAAWRGAKPRFTLKMVSEDKFAVGPQSDAEGRVMMRVGDVEGFVPAEEAMLAKRRVERARRIKERGQLAAGFYQWQTNIVERDMARIPVVANASNASRANGGAKHSGARSRSSSTAVVESASPQAGVLHIGEEVARLGGYGANTSNASRANGGAKHSGARSRSSSMAAVESASPQAGVHDMHIGEEVARLGGYGAVERGDLWAAVASGVGLPKSMAQHVRQRYEDAARNAYAVGDTEDEEERAPRRGYSDELRPVPEGGRERAPTLDATLNRLLSFEESDHEESRTHNSRGRTPSPSPLAAPRPRIGTPRGSTCASAGKRSDTSKDWNESHYMRDHLSGRTIRRVDVCARAYWNRWDGSSTASTRALTELLERSTRGGRQV